MAHLATDPPLGDAGVGCGFRLLWASVGLSAAGSGLRATVLPLLAAAASADPRAVAGVVAAGLQLMVRVDLARAAVMALCTAAVAVHATPIVLLAAVAFSVAAGNTVHVNASTALLPQLVAPAGLPAANSRLVTTAMLAGELLAPAVAGALYAAGAAVPTGMDAVSFTTAALLVLAIGPARSGPPHPCQITTVRGELSAGLRVLLRHPLLRPLTALVAILAGVSGALVALLVLYAERRLHLTAAGYGSLVSAYAAGGLIGSLNTPRLLHHCRAGILIMTALALTVAGLTGLGFTTSPLTAAASLCLFGTAVGLWQVTTTSLLQTVVPARLLGRVSAAFHTTAATTAALGALTGGALAAQTGIPLVLYLSAASVTLTGLALGRPILAATMPAG